MADQLGVSQSMISQGESGAMRVSERYVRSVLKACWVAARLEAEQEGANEGVISPAKNPRADRTDRPTPVYVSAYHGIPVTAEQKAEIERLAADLPGML